MDAIFVSPAAVSIPVGGSVPLSATAKNGSGTLLAPSSILYLSDSPAIATVDIAGTVSGLRVGTTWITITTTATATDDVPIITVPIIVI